MAEADDTKRKAAHTVVDHLYGADLQHEHEGAADHDHDHDDVGDYDLENDALWIQDHITLVCVGIDIGSSGTQVIFSRVYMRRLAEDLTSRYFVVKRETLYESPVALTPYQSETRIDERAVGDIVDGAYEAAGIHPDNIDTGAVILTGEALRRENAKAIADVIAEMGGEFVCATAGHHMESLLAAYGSGAARASHDLQALLNVDIGGGTTKLALVENGRVVAHGGDPCRWAARGGRQGRVARLDPAGKAPREERGTRLVARRAGERRGHRTRDRMDGRRAGEGAHGDADAGSRRRALAHRSARARGGHRGRDVLGRRRPNTSTGARSATSATSDGAWAARCAGASTRARFPIRCCPRANASAPPPSARPNTACSSRATRSTSPNPGELLPRKNLQVLQPDVVARRRRSRPRA